MHNLLMSGWYINSGEFLVSQSATTKFCISIFFLVFEVQTYMLIFMALAIYFLSFTMWVHVNAENVINFPFGNCIVLP